MLSKGQHQKNVIKNLDSRNTCSLDLIKENEEREKRRRRKERGKQLQCNKHKLRKWGTLTKN